MNPFLQLLNKPLSTRLTRGERRMAALIRADLRSAAEPT